ncbi:MAG: chromate transporter [Clostridiales bacterium]|nr:chromate transporter [Clostridiales bacterium]
MLKTLLLVYYEFFKVGLFSIGGGLATVPFLKEIAMRYDWFDLDMLSTMIAVAESTPGAIGVNMATYSGFVAGHSAGGLMAGLVGCVISTLGLISPAIIVITLVSKAYKKFRDNHLVQSGFYGVRPAVTGMIASAGLIIIQAAFLKGSIPAYTGIWTWVREFLGIVDYKAVILFAAAFIALRKIKVHPIWFIVTGGVLGAVFLM